MRNLIIGGILISGILFTSMVYAHCQVPCGIYDDPARLDMIAENITTIEKSMKEIAKLSKKDTPNMNQVVRWVSAKEKHADHLSHIITYYFLAQRVKPIDPSNSGDYDNYIKKLTLLHKMLVSSMKAKQTVDLTNVRTLRSLLTEFRTEYFKA
jgi:nickel superoxide dismutase